LSSLGQINWGGKRWAGVIVTLLELHVVVNQICLTVCIIRNLFNFPNTQLVLFKFIAVVAQLHVGCLAASKEIEKRRVTFQVDQSQLKSKSQLADV